MEKVKRDSTIVKTMIEFEVFTRIEKFLRRAVNPLSPMSVKWHLQILLCLTPDDLTRQWGTP